MSGHIARSPGNARGNRNGPTVGITPSLSCVIPAAVSACAVASKSATFARISRARSARAFPIGVMRTEWVLRSATVTPSRASISLRAVERVDCVTLHNAADREKFSVSARATRNRIWRRVVIVFFGYWKYRSPRSFNSISRIYPECLSPVSDVQKEKDK